MPSSETCILLGVHCVSQSDLLPSVKQLGQLIKQGKLHTETACLHLLITESLGAGSNTFPLINKTLFFEQRENC